MIHRVNNQTNKLIIFKTVHFARRAIIVFKQQSALWKEDKTQYGV